jgi:nucleoside-diphosphate-sugar epimerase
MSSAEAAARPLPPGPILVTGATGFIGSRLTATIRERGGQVRTFGRRAGSVDVAGDLTDAASIAPAVRGCRTIFHLAALVHDRRAGDRDRHRAAGRDGTAHLIEAASAAGVASVVFVSSLAVYGSTFPKPVSEDDPCHPDSAYGQAKLDAEQLVLAWGAGGRRAVCLRPAMTYGPGCKGNLPRLMRAISAGWCPPIPVTPARRSLLHVQSLVEVLLLAAADARAAGRIFNVADAETLSTGEMYEVLMRALGRRAPAWRVPLGAFRLAAGVGDLLSRATGRAPFDRRAYATLFGPAVARTARLEQDLGYLSPRTFSGSADELVDAFRRGGPG